MKKIPDNVCEAWDRKEGPIIFTTVDTRGIPNSIYATCVSKYDDSRIVIADNYFGKTRENIKNGSKGSVLFITKEGRAFQVKGSIEYLANGDLFDDMKKWNPAKHPGHAAVVLTVEEVYSGSEKLL